MVTQELVYCLEQLFRVVYMVVEGGYTNTCTVGFFCLGLFYIVSQTDILKKIHSMLYTNYSSLNVCTDAAITKLFFLLARVL